MTKHLTERRKADRDEMAKRIQALAASYGIPTTRDPDPYPLGERETWVFIKPENGPHLTLDFDGDSWQPDVFVLSWHMDLGDPRIIAPGFTRSINEHHRRKATDVCEGFTALEATLTARFDCIARGAALVDPPEDGPAN